MAENRKNTKKHKDKKGKRIKIFKISSITAVVLVILIALLPLIASTGLATAVIKGKIAKAADAEIELGNLKITWRSGITLEGVSYADSRGIVVDAQKIYAKINYITLLGGNIEISNALIENAAITLVVDENNPSELSEEAAAVVAAFIPQQQRAKASGFEFRWVKFNYIRNILLDLKNVSVVLELIEQNQQRSTLEIASIEGRIRVSPPGQTCGIDVKAFIGGEKSPLNLYCLARRPELFFDKREFGAQIKTNIGRLNLSSLAPVLRIAGIDNDIVGSVDFDLNAEIEKGFVTRSRATLNSEQVSFLITGTNNRIDMKDFNSTVSLNTNKDFVNVRELKAGCDWFELLADGQFPSSNAGIEEFFSPSSGHMFNIKLYAALNRALAQFPELLGKNDMQVKTGDIVGNFSTSSLGEDSKVFFGNVSLSNFTAFAGGKDIRLNAPITLRTEIASRPQGLLIDPLELSAMFINLNCSGMIDDLKIHGVIPLRAAQQELGDIIDFGDYDYNGEIAINADLVPSIRTLNGTAFLENFSVSNRQGKRILDPYSDVSFGFKHDKVEDRLWITSMFIKSSMLGEIELLQGFFNFKQEQDERFVSMFRANSDIAKIFELLDMYGKKPENIDAKGLFSCTSRLFIRDDGMRIVSDDTGVTNLVIQTADNNYNTAGAVLTFDVDFKPQINEYSFGNLGIRNDWARLNVSKFKYKADEKTGSLETDFTLAYDLKKLTDIEKFIPDGLQLRGERSQTGSIKLSFGEDGGSILNNIDTSIGLGFDSIKYMGLNFGKADFSVALKDGVLDILPFSVPLNEGALNLALNADFTSENTVLKIAENMRILDAVAINDELSNELLKFVNPIFAGSVNSSGKINVLCNKFELPLGADILDNMLADAQIEIKDLRLVPAGMLGQILELTGTRTGQLVALGANPTNIKIADGKLSYDDMTIYLAGKPVSFGGSIAFAGNIDMDVKVPYSYTIGGKTQTQQVVLPIDGDASSPRVDTRRLLESNTQVIEQAIDRAIEEKVDEATAEIIRESVRGLQELFRNR